MAKPNKTIGFPRYDDLPAEKHDALLIAPLLAMEELLSAAEDHDVDPECTVALTLYSLAAVLRKHGVSASMVQSLVANAVRDADAVLDGEKEAA